MYKTLRGIVYGAFFILMGITLIYDTWTSESLSLAMQAIDNVYGTVTFGVAFIICGLILIYTGYSRRKWILISFSPYIIYGSVIAYYSFTTRLVSTFGNLVLLLLASLMMLDWFWDTGIVQRIRGTSV